MKPPDYAKAHIVASAALGALTEAVWQSRDLLSGPCAEAAPDLLRRLAGEMACSPIARDQVLSLALCAAAGDLEAGLLPASAIERILLPPGPDDIARLEVRAQVLGLGFLPAADARRAADELERRHRPECASDLELSARLTAEANLHELLWDDPRLPGDDRVRLTMLFSVPALLERAEALGPARRARTPSTAVGGQLRERRPWRLRSVLGLPLAGWFLAAGPAVAAVAGGVLVEG